MLATFRKPICFILALVFFAVQTARAQQHTPTAPVPPQVTQANTVFISNAGADSLFLAFSDGKDRAYNDLYASIKQWGNTASSPHHQRPTSSSKSEPSPHPQISLGPTAH